MSSVRKSALLWALLWAPLATPYKALADTYTGTVSQIQVNDTGSMDFRVILSTPMTNCNLNFAFTDHASALFSTFVATIMTASSTGRVVSLQVNREASGFCRIYFASM